SEIAYALGFELLNPSVRFLKRKPKFRHWSFGRVLTDNFFPAAAYVSQSEFITIFCPLSAISKMLLTFMKLSIRYFYDFFHCKRFLVHQYTKCYFKLTLVCH